VFPSDLSQYDIVYDDLYVIKYGSPQSIEECFLLSAGHVDHKIYDQIIIEETEEYIKTYNFYPQYKKDIDQFGKKDYWQTPYEFEKNNGGDCEDFCIYFMATLYAKFNIKSELFCIYFRINRIHNDGHAYVEINDVYFDCIGNKTYSYNEIINSIKYIYKEQIFSYEQVIYFSEITKNNI